MPTAKSSNERLGDLYAANAGNMAQALPEILALIISVILPLIQGCFKKGTTAKSIAGMMKCGLINEVKARTMVLLAMREAGLHRRPDADVLYRTIIDAGKSATAQDVIEFKAENER